jgi:hypothetical protein
VTAAASVAQVVSESTKPVAAAALEDILVLADRLVQALQIRHYVQDSQDKVQEPAVVLVDTTLLVLKLLPVAAEEAQDFWALLFL